MAIAANDLTPVTNVAPLDVIPFAVNATSADASGTEELKAAPDTGKSLVVTHLVISCVAAITVTIGAGETGGAVTAVLFGPFNFAATSGAPIDIKFHRPIKLADASALVVDASGAGALQVLVEGYTE